MNIKRTESKSIIYLHQDFHGIDPLKLSFSGCFNRSVHCKSIFSLSKMGSCRQRREENLPILKEDRGFPLQIDAVFRLHCSTPIRVWQNLDALEPLSSTYFMTGIKMDSGQDKVNFSEISSLASFFIFHHRKM